MVNRILIWRHCKKIVVIFFVLTPILSAILFCMKDGRRISDIYIPLGGWSDEITYYKQIEGILSYGMPRGYFGYNQSRALHGSLGVWGLTPLIPYVIWGYFFGWNYCSPIFANIFFCVIALIAICIFLRPEKRWMVTFAVFWVTNQFLNRYVLSGVVEASVMTQLMLVITGGEYLLSDRIREQKERVFSAQKDTAVLLFVTLLICILTVARPYFAVLFLIPFWKAIIDRRKGWVAGLPFVTVMTIAAFFLNNYYFCSTYFRNMLSFEEVRSGGIVGFWERLSASLIEIVKLIWYAVRYKGSGVGWYYLLLLIELSAMFCVCIYRICRHRKAPRMFIAALIGESLILLSIIELYDLGVGARHILALITVNMVLLMLEVHFTWGIVLAAVCVVSIFQTQGADVLPYGNEEYMEYMETLEQEFNRIVQVTGEISYDNVVAMPTADRNAHEPERGVCTYYGLLFAMPAGVGISLDYEDFYDNPENIKAKYIMVHPEGKIKDMLENMGMHCAFENEELMLYVR